MLRVFRERNPEVYNFTISEFVDNYIDIIILMMTQDIASTGSLSLLRFSDYSEV